MGKQPRIRVRKLGLGDTTEEGSFYAQVDGENVGEDGRAFWETRDDAQRCGERFLAAKTG
ncbi:hypothetical protein [Afipia carboxidovorans]|uniref:hypothetical protein n=1 Tax=Afipia carboxidovorans TaxID=40137 RepID=UPI0030D19789